MSESAAVLSFARLPAQRAAEVRRTLLPVYQQDRERLAAESPNVLVSLQWCYDTQRWTWVLEFAEALADFLHLQGWGTEALHVAQLATVAAQQVGDRSAEVHWLFYTGLTLDDLRRDAEAEAAYARCLALTDDLALQAEIRRRQGWLAAKRGELSLALERYQQGMALHRQIGDRVGEARDWRQCGLALESSAGAEARRCWEQGLALIAGDTTAEAQRVRAGCELDRGRLALAQGDLAAAEAHLRAALVAGQATDDRLLQGDIVFHQGLLAELRGEWDLARQKYQERLLLAQAADDRPGQAAAWLALGTLAWHRPPGVTAPPDQATARECYEAALRVGDPVNRIVAQAQLGALAYAQGDMARAQSLLAPVPEQFIRWNRLQEAAAGYYQLGLVAQAQGQWTAAQAHYQASLELRRRLNLALEVVETLFQLGELARAQRHWEAARTHYQEAWEQGQRVGAPLVPALEQRLRQLPPARRWRLFRRQ